MDELQKYQMVNSCKTFEEIWDCILKFADSEGNIQGRTRKFDARKMAENAKIYYNDPDCHEANIVTREYGLRQQLIMLKLQKH